MGIFEAYAYASFGREMQQLQEKNQQLIQAFKSKILSRRSSNKHCHLEKHYIKVHTRTNCKKHYFLFFSHTTKLYTAIMFSIFVTTFYPILLRLELKLSSLLQATAY